MYETQLRKFKLFLIIAFLLYLVLLVGRGCIRQNEIANRYQEVKKQYLTAFKNNENLKHKSQLLKSDLFVEVAARKKLGLVKQGEQVFRIRTEE